MSGSGAAPLSEAAKSAMRTRDIGSSDGPVDIIERVRRGSNTLPEPELPGHGEPYTAEDDRPACGEDRQTRVCDSCGEDHSIGATCDRWGCPRCYKRAAVKASTRVTAKLAHYRDKYSRGSDLRFHRVIIVPPPEEEYGTVAADPLDKFYEQCGDLLEQGASYHGGVRIPHPYRHADEPALDLDPADGDLSDRELALIGGDDDRGVWKHTLPDWSDDHVPDWEEETRPKLVHEPHMHAYLVSESFWLPTEEIYEETGWIIKRLEPYGDDDNHVSCYDVEDLARSVMYALSHAGMYENSDKYRYFGALANEPASDAQERRMSRICRDYAQHVIGLSTSSTTCKRRLSGTEDAGGVPAAAAGGGGGGRPPAAADGGDEWGEAGGGGVNTGFSDGDGGSWAGEGGGGLPVTHAEPAGDESADDAEDGDGDEGEVCGGRLVHLRTVPQLVEERDWPEERTERLLELYEAEYGPPPEV